MSASVVVLAGGTGGAKLARGMLDVVGPDRLTVIANPGDDIEIYGAYVSPDPDLVLFWLADRIDLRGWGLAGDTFHVMEGLRELGAEVWFNLGDRDLAIGLQRGEALAGGRRLTDTIRALAEGLAVPARVLPPADEPVRTRVLSGDAWYGFQEFMIRRRAEGPIDDVEFHGARGARATPEVRAAIEHAEAILIGPSNPVISIGPILAVPGIREALAATRAPIVAVSPIVAGEIVKGPTAAFMRWAGWELSSDGIAMAYAGFLDGLVADARTPALPVLETDVLMATPQERRRLAAEALAFARALGTREG